MDTEYKEKMMEISKEYFSGFVAASCGKVHGDNPYRALNLNAPRALQNMTAQDLREGVRHLDWLDGMDDYFKKREE